MPRQNRNPEGIAALLPVSPYLSGNALVCGDNLDVLREIPDECVDLIYADPPFNSNSNYNAVFGDKGRVEAQLRDVWRWTVETENAYRRMQPGRLLDAINGIRLIAGAESKMAAYAVFMGRRLEEMRRALKPAGSIYLHCDPTANWLLRVLLDAVFGESQFRNEIVWAYTGPGNAKRWFPRKHDTLLFYSKTGKNLFQRDAVRIPYVKLETGNTQGIFKGAATLSDSGKVPEDYWLEGRDGMTPVTRLHGERVGYPTQKPTALLEGIIKASAPPNGLVMDPFCGCGTAADAAAKLGRGYLGIDISAVAVRVMEQRLASRGGAAMPVVYKMDWDDYEWEHFERRALAGRDDTEAGIPGWAWAEDKVAGLLGAVPNERKAGDGGVDARYYTATEEVIPIQVKMYANKSVTRPDMDRLLGTQTAMQNRGINAPMSLMVSLYPPPPRLRLYATQQGRVKVGCGDFPVMQVLSVQEMLTKGERPKLPPPNTRWLIGDTNTRMAMA